MGSDRGYGGLWEKSIEYPRKVYRLFSDRSLQTLCINPSPAPIPSYKRSVTSHPPLRFLRSSAPKETQRKSVRSRCEEQCYARKGKKGKASLPSPFQFYCSGNPYYQVASCIAFCSMHPFAHRKVPFTEQQMHPSAETLFGFPLLYPMRWLLQTYYPFGETATGSG